MFSLKEAKLYRAIKLSQNPLFSYAKVFKKISFLFFVFFLVAFIYGFLMNNFSVSLNSKILGLLSLSLYFWILFSLLNSFFGEVIKKNTNKLNDDFKNNFNLADVLSFNTLKLIYETEDKFKEDFCCAVLYRLLSIKSKRIDFIFNRLLIDKNAFKKELLDHIKTKKHSGKDIETIILSAAQRAKSYAKNVVQITDLFYSFCENNDLLKDFLLKNNISLDDVNEVILWVEKVRDLQKKSSRWWDRENLLLKGSIGREWSFGYTPTLDAFSFDWTRTRYAVYTEEVFGHDKELKELESILSKKGINNALIIGLVGSGRRSLIRKLAQKSFVGESVPELNFLRFVELDLKKMLTVSENMAQFEKLLNKIFNEVIEAGNIILIVEDIHNFANTKREVGRVDITGILTPYLKSELFRIIAITDPSSYFRYIEDNKTFDSLFEKIQVREITLEEALQIIKMRALVKEYQYKKFISFKALKLIVNLCEKYIPNIPFPEKAIRILDEVFNYAKNLKVQIITEDIVYEVFSNRLGIPVGKIEEKEKEKLLNLEELIHQRIIDQQEAVEEISSALRRARSEITIRKGPLGAFLFLGPTGVGKTETAKALADIYFGSEENIIRLDMSEFQNIEDVEKLIGGDNYPEGILSQKVKEKPFSLLLLDEIEKANLNILNLFLQVLDEGHLMDASGQRISFNHTIIIATSNAGYELIVKSIKEGKEMQSIKEELIDYLIQNSIFRPEFLNRFDAIVVFKNLSKEDLLEIANLMLTKLKKNLQDKGIEFVITEDVKEKIAKLGFNPIFGAREMRRVIQDKLEDEIAKALLKGELKAGDKFKFVVKGEVLLLEKIN